MERRAKVAATQRGDVKGGEVVVDHCLGPPVVGEGGTAFAPTPRPLPLVSPFLWITLGCSGIAGHSPIHSVFRFNADVAVASAFI